MLISTQAAHRAYEFNVVAIGEGAAYVLGSPGKGLPRTMIALSALDPSQRQVLVNLGNRHVVFGPSSGLPRPTYFRPETDSNQQPYLSDDSDAEITGQRIVQTIRVSGMKKLRLAEDTANADVEFLDDEGNRIVTDIKVRERDPKSREIAQWDQQLKEAAQLGRTSEIWCFNTERLKLIVMHYEGTKLRIDELYPIDVWETTTDGVYTRAQVAEDVTDWIHRVETLYADIRTWLIDRPDLRCEQTRTVVTSEDLMQKFAVTDQEIPVLDVLGPDEVVASFVPRGLWLIGSWGRIDIITREQTHVLVALKETRNLAWYLLETDERRHKVVFDRDRLLALVGQP